MGTTSAQKKLFFNLRKVKGRIGALEDGDLRPENVTKIASELRVSEAEVVSMNRRMAGVDSSLNSRISQAEDGGEAEWQDWLEDENANHASDYENKQELDTRRALLAEAMVVLNEREKEILAFRQLSDQPKTLEELSQIYKVSRERIRQIEVKALEKLRNKIKELSV